MDPHLSRMSSPPSTTSPLHVLWFRHGLRLHDNPSLTEAAAGLDKADGARLLPIFIFDGESAGTKLCSFNRFKFLLECLGDLDDQLRDVGAQMHFFR